MRLPKIAFFVVTTYIAAQANPERRIPRLFSDMKSLYLRAHDVLRIAIRVLISPLFLSPQLNRFKLLESTEMISMA